ncbi:phenylalanine--tRNA ligase subunit beta [Candidatus Peregrinibacteria bacterium]|nr:phenylalanine--tRNA ligase subunit beta [Candidatus Peregrinibacteria bacterium]
MKISVNWLKNYVNIPANTNFHDFGNLFTIRTAEVEEVIDLAKSFDKMVIGKIESITPHPDADKLRITKTNIGSETLQIVCGASNIHEGQIVAVALIGSKVRWHGEGDLVELKPVKIRGVDSQGMICAASEIGLKDEVDGIMDLSHLKAKPGTSLANALNKSDTIIDIENKTLTHRPDLWGHYGIAREIAAILDEKLKPVQVFNKYDNKLPRIVDVEVQSPDLCPRYLTVTIDNIKVEPSPEWLRNALENTGNRSINNIVDATNFVMLELGNPLHAFDRQTIKDKLVIRRAHQGEKITTLDNEEKTLDTETLIIADVEKPLAIAGVKGGLHSGINEKTTTITLEAANFNPISTRKSSIRHNIRTEAVQRYEKDLDPLLAEQALDRLVQIILDLCPQAKIISSKQDVNNFKYKPRTIKLNLAQASSKIGVELDTKTVKALLEKLEFEVKATAKTIEVLVPSFRATKDINHQDDLVEEIARLYGYEKLPVLLPTLHMRPGTPNTERQGKYAIRNILSLEHGFSEALNYSFYSQKTLENCSLDPAKHLKVKNYLSEEQTHLRLTLIPGLLKNTAENLKQKSSFRLYEFGRTYKNINQFFPLEEKQLAGLILLDKKSKDQPFYKAKTVIQSLLAHLNLNSLQYRKAESHNTFAHPNKHAAWFDHKTKQEIIQIYELHPGIAKHYDLDKQLIACFEINYTELHKLPHGERRFRPIPKFPSIEIDISALFDENQQVVDIEKAIRKADQNLITAVQLFDFYQGSNIPAGKKALAYKIILQSNDRTLTEAEMRSTQQKIFSNLQALGAEIRGL